MVQKNPPTKYHNYKKHPTELENFPRARTLRKSDLGGVIFGCTHYTFAECHSKQLFGLPSQHFGYVRNIEGGLPLFLFNYSDRKMHGLYEAAGNGELYVDKYAWTDQGTEKTPYPAQVPIRIKEKCYPVEEKEFINVIKDNYYDQHKFWFELDHAQTRALTALFKKAPFITNPRLPPVPSFSYVVKKPVRDDNSKKLKSKEAESSSNQPDEEAVSDWEVLGPESEISNSNSNLTSNDEAEKERVLGILKRIRESKEKGVDLKSSKEKVNCDIMDDRGVSANNSFANDELQKEIKELSERMLVLEKNQEKKDQEIKNLKNTIDQSERKIDRLETQIYELKSSSSTSISRDRENSSRLFVEQEVIYLLGGNNGFSYLSDFDSFSPSSDILTPLKPISCAKSYMGIATLNGSIFVLGGHDGNSWFDTVERYDRSKEEWVPQACLNKEKGCLAGVSLNEKIYALGGKDCGEYFSEVEMLDPTIGKWLNFLPMIQKRSTLGAASLNGLIYAVGGYDGDKYLSSGEKLDTREPSWKKIPNMNTRRGTHSLAVLNDKLYAVGGYDGNSTVPSIEWYDPRMPKWVMAEPMSCERGYVATCVVGGALFAIGGSFTNRNSIVDIVECYREGRGWIDTGSKAIGKRCCSAVAF